MSQFLHYLYTLALPQDNSCHVNEAKQIHIIIVAARDEEEQSGGGGQPSLMLPDYQGWLPPYLLNEGRRSHIYQGRNYDMELMVGAGEDIIFLLQASFSWGKKSLRICLHLSSLICRSLTYSNFYFYTSLTLILTHRRGMVGL